MKVRRKYVLYAWKGVTFDTIIRHFAFEGYFSSGKFPSQAKCCLNEKFTWTVSFQFYDLMILQSQVYLVSIQT